MQPAVRPAAFLNLNFMDISKLGSFLGGAGSILGSIGSAVGGIFQASANRRFQAKQAELQRQFNATEAQKARDYNTQMINAQNLYNSPQEQVKRLAAAGLHPSLAYGGNGAIQNIGVGSTSAQASSSASPSGAMPDLSGFSNIASSLESFSNARNADSVRNLNDTELKYRDEILSGNVKLLGADIELKGSAKKVADNQADYLAKDISRLKSTIELIDAQVITEGRREDYFHALEQFVGKRIDWFDRCMTADIMAKVASAGLSNKQAWQIGQLTPYILNLMSADIGEKVSLKDLHISQKNLTDILQQSGLADILKIDEETNSIRFNIDNAWAFRVFDAFISILSSTLAGSAGSGFFKGKPAKVGF